MNLVSALLYAVASSCLIAVFANMLHNGLEPMLAALSLCLGASIGTWAFMVQWFQDRREAAVAGTIATPRSPLNPWQWIAITIFTLFSLRAFLWLVNWQSDELKLLSPNNLGDLSIHITFLMNVASGANFFAESPIYAPDPLTYPIGIDLFNGLLTMVGIDMVRGLVWVGLIGCACMATGLWRWGGAFALVAILCNGGSAALTLFQTGQLVDFQADFAWKSIPLSILVTQRGFLFALPAGLLLLSSWRERWLHKSGGPTLPLAGEWLLYASMPLFHLHTFLFLSLVLGLIFVFSLVDGLLHKTEGYKKGPSDEPPVNPGLQAAWQTVTLAMLAFLPATALVFLVTGNFHGDSTIGWKPGWMHDPAKESFLGFWLSNFGVFFPFTLLVIWRIFAKQAWKSTGVFVLAGITVFIACALWRFAPWEWDNTKLMVWGYLAIIPGIWTLLLKDTHLVIRAIAIFLLFGSGFLSMLGGIGPTFKGFGFAHRSEIDFTLAAVRELSPNERFIGYPTYNHPVLLSGRRMAMGYPGHLYSQGLNYDPRQQTINSILEGSPDWQVLCKELGTRYLYWGRFEREHYPASSQPWRDTAKLVITTPTFEIYDVFEISEPQAASTPQPPEPGPEAAPEPATPAPPTLETEPAPPQP